MRQPLVLLPRQTQRANPWGCWNWFDAATARGWGETAIVAAQPLVTNVAVISGELRGPGALGVWALGTNAPFQLESALTNANALMVNMDTNLNQLTEDITLTLLNVANITSTAATRSSTALDISSHESSGVERSRKETNVLLLGPGQAR